MDVNKGHKTSLCANKKKFWEGLFKCCNCLTGYFIVSYFAGFHTHHPLFFASFFHNYFIRCMMLDLPFLEIAPSAICFSCYLTGVCMGFE